MIISCSNSSYEYEEEKYNIWKDDLLIIKYVDITKQTNFALFKTEKNYRSYIKSSYNYNEIIDISLLTESKYKDFCKEIIHKNVDEVLSSKNIIYRAKSETSGMYYEIIPLLDRSNCIFAILKFDLNNNFFKDCLYFFDDI